MNRRRPLPSRARRRPLPLLAFFVAALAALLMPAVRPDPVDAQATLNSQATLTVLTAPVEVQRASGNRDSASSGTTVVVGDRVFTGTGGAAKLTFFQGTEVDIAPDSEVMVQEMTQRVSGASTVSFGQAVGSTVAKVASLFNPASRVQVSTQSAVAVVRGTELEVTVTKEQVQVFKSNTGSFDVIAGGQTQRVKDGEVTVVPPPPPPPPPPTTRDTRTVGDATVSLPSGNDRPPLPPVPVAEIGKLFQKVAELTAKDGPPVVATPPVAVRDLVDAAQGRPVVLRPMGATPVPPPVATPPPPPPTVPPVATRAPTPVAATPPPAQQSSNNNTATLPPTSTSGCSSPASTATPTAAQFGLGGQVVDASGTALSCASVHVYQEARSAAGHTYSDASGTFRVILDAPSTSATGTFVFTAYHPDHTQQVVPTATATAGQLVTLSSPIVMKPNDATISGSVWSGAAATPAAGSIVSIELSSPRVAVKSTTVATSGAYSLAVASGTYSYLSAAQFNTPPYAYRSAVVPLTSVPSGTLASQDVILPSLEVTSSLTCQQTGAPCSVTVSGKGWTSAGEVSIGALDSSSIYRQFGTVTPTNGEFSTRTLVSNQTSWPTGTYTIMADQALSSTFGRIVKLDGAYVVSAGTASSCGTNIGSGSATVRVSGTVKTHTNSPVAYACVQVSTYGQNPPFTTYALSDASGNYSADVTAADGDFYIKASKIGYTQGPSVYKTSSNHAVTSDVELNPNTVTLQGFVRSASSSMAISGASISLMNQPIKQSSQTSVPDEMVGQQITSGSDGSFTIQVPSTGAYWLSITKSSFDGFQQGSMRVSLQGLATTNLQVTIPTVSIASASCTTDVNNNPPCSIVITSGSGWTLSQSVEVKVVNPTSDPSLSIESAQSMGTVPSSSGNISGTATPQSPPVWFSGGTFRVWVLQEGTDGQYIKILLDGNTQYTVTRQSVQVNSVRSSAVTPPVTATTAPSASPTAPSTVVATPSPSTSSPSSTTSVPTTVVATVTPTVSATPTP
jgi:hypothetical protein